MVGFRGLILCSNYGICPLDDGLRSFWGPPGVQLSRAHPHTFPLAGIELHHEGKGLSALKRASVCIDGMQLVLQFVRLTAHSFCSTVSHTRARYSSPVKGTKTSLIEVFL